MCFFAFLTGEVCSCHHSPNDILLTLIDFGIVIASVFEFSGEWVLREHVNT